MPNLQSILKLDLSYCDPSLKNTFHREAKRVLTLVAKEMGLDKSDYDIRSNKGGIAGGGEITLHTDNVYVQISDFSMQGNNLLLRACEGRKDYSGMQNHWAPVSALNDIPVFATYLKLLSKNSVIGTQWIDSQVRNDVAHHRADEINSPIVEQARTDYEDEAININEFERIIKGSDPQSPAQQSLF